MPRVTLETLRSLEPSLDPRLAEEHLTRLDKVYFHRFDPEEIVAHIQALEKINPQQPVQVLVRKLQGTRFVCTILSFDYASVFSLITGVLAGMGFNIESGDVFTYSPPGPVEKKPRRRGSLYRRGPIQLDPLRRCRIIDCFYGVLDLDMSFQQWREEFEQRLSRIVLLLEKGDDAAINEAKQRVNRLVTDHLAAGRSTTLPVLYPVSVKISNDAGLFTRLHIESQDTPAFLYTLSTALSLRPISILNMRIRTIQGRVEDDIDMLDGRGRQITDQRLLDRIRFSVLLTRQFSYFLDKAPDPYAALSRFECLLEDILKLPESGQWTDLLSNPHAMRDLARLLGASDFLWEDFIRLQYESLLPLLDAQVDQHRFSLDDRDFSRMLTETLGDTESFEERKKRLNTFKNHQIYLIDLDHILNPKFTFRHMAERLSALAAAVVAAAAQLAEDKLVAEFGKPQAVAGLPASFAIFGLGKLGGAALGYASDIELLFVYSDQGVTDGKKSITNAEFYDRLVLDIFQIIEAKKEGIFSVDLRLRPYGSSGPRACSVESFCSYYGPGGPAHSAERLALVRLRRVGGDSVLGKRIQRLRDEFIYSASRSILPEEIRQLRHKQFKERVQPGVQNAKFSRGALVDLEYAVQLLQVSYGGEFASLRTPRIHRALDALRDAGFLSPEECEQLNGAYDFLRRLINGLRMLRGSAVELTLPPEESEEYIHLARRLGYRHRDGMEPQQQFRVDFATHTAVVRAFVERHFGADTLPGPASGNLADLVLTDTPSEDFQQRILVEHGFVNPVRACRNLRALAGDGEQREVFARLAVLSADYLHEEPDPDMALNNWERFVQALEDPVAHYRLFLSQPRHLELLLGIFSRSQFLADTLIRHPDVLQWVTDPKNVRSRTDAEALLEQLRHCSATASDHAAWLTELRRLRRREILRIGTRDMCLHVSTDEIMHDISELAEAVVRAAVERAWQELRREDKVPESMPRAEEGFCLLAFGKLGGRELNYSSDIDLLGCFQNLDAAPQTAVEEIYAKMMERVAADLSSHTVEGRAYRVDLRLRPYGGTGRLIYSLDSLVAYYQDEAAFWELQAALKLRPVGGNLALGNQLIAHLQPLLQQPRGGAVIARTIRNMREQAVQQEQRRLLAVTPNVKTGAGGIRDIEFMVQGLQLLHAPQRPALLAGNTLVALNALTEAQILAPEQGQRLRTDYLFLRRIEHYLQILEDQQKHELPSDPAELRALSRRMLGNSVTEKVFMEQIDHCRQRVREQYEQTLEQLERTPKPE